MTQYKNDDLPPESGGEDGNEKVDAVIKQAQDSFLEHGPAQIPQSSSRREKALRKILAAREMERRMRADAVEGTTNIDGGGDEKKPRDATIANAFREKVADKGDGGDDGAGKGGLFSRFMPKNWRDKRFWTLIVLALLTTVVLVLVVIYFLIPAVEISGGNPQSGGVVGPSPSLPIPGPKPSGGGAIVTPAVGQWSFKIEPPLDRTKITGAWLLLWAIMVIVINPIFRTESIHRGEAWDWLNVTVVLAISTLVIIFIRPLAFAFVEQCKWWMPGGNDVLPPCFIKGDLSLTVVDFLANIGYLITFVLVAGFSASASIAGKWDFSPLANGIFSYGVIVKLLLSSPEMQLFSSGIIILGVLIYVLEIAGVAPGLNNAKEFFSWDWIRWTNIVVALLAQVILWGLGWILALAAGALSGYFYEKGFADFASVLYAGRAFLGIALSSLVASMLAFFFTQAVGPMVERIGSGTVTSGDADKLDAILFVFLSVTSTIALNIFPLLQRFV